VDAEGDGTGGELTPDEGVVADGAAIGLDGPSPG
jgi:hypothetical protein